MKHLKEQRKSDKIYLLLLESVWRIVFLLSKFLSGLKHLKKEEKNTQLGVARNWHGHQWAVHESFTSYLPHLLLDFKARGQLLLFDNLQEIYLLLLEIYRGNENDGKMLRLNR